MSYEADQVILVGDQTVRLRWLEKSPHPADNPRMHSAWLTHMIQATHEDVVVGRLRVSYVTKESSYAAAPDGLHFLAQNRGWCLNFDDEKDLWCRAHQYADLTPKSLRHLDSPPSPRSLSKDDAPSSPIIADDLCELHERGEHARANFLHDYAIPTVAYPLVSDGIGEFGSPGVNWRRRGLATQMYCFRARVLASRAMVLMASSLQTDAAAALWESLERDPHIPTRRIRVSYHDGSSDERLVIDYQHQLATI